MRKKIIKNKLPQQVEIDADGHFTEYAASNKTIRVWFVTFGIGGLYLLLTNNGLLLKLKEAHELKTIAILFLIGMGAQLFIALINKWVNWYMYYFEENDFWYCKFMQWLSKQFWIDIICDIGTCYCFGKVIWILINIYNSDVCQK